MARDEQRRLTVAVVDDRVVRQRVERGAVGREQEAQRAGQDAQLDAQREAGIESELRARHHTRTHILRTKASAARELRRHEERPTADFERHVARRRWRQERASELLLLLVGAERVRPATLRRLVPDARLARQVS